jgi:hypothetical protein
MEALKRNIATVPAKAKPSIGRAKKRKKVS